MVLGTGPASTTVAPPSRPDGTDPSRHPVTFLLETATADRAPESPRPCSRSSRRRRSPTWPDTPPRGSTCRRRWLSAPGTVALAPAEAPTGRPGTRTLHGDLFLVLPRTSRTPEASGLMNRTDPHADALTEPSTSSLSPELPHQVDSRGPPQPPHDRALHHAVSTDCHDATIDRTSATAPTQHPEGRQSPDAHTRDEGYFD